MRNQTNEKERFTCDASEWDDFWESRKETEGGRFVSWVRQRFVTPALIRYFLHNTEKGTLVEAGCGTGEVTLSVSRIRGDKAVLVDRSARALAMARQRAAELGVEATFIDCDIEQLGGQLERTENSIVYNVGVIEHFEDCTHVLREMGKASGLYAVALVPEKSLFWSNYVTLSFRLGWVPSNFYVYLFDESELRQVVEKADMKILWVRRLWVLGIIPYLGICFRSPEKSK